MSKCDGLRHSYHTSIRHLNNDQRKPRGKAVTRNRIAHHDHVLIAVKGGACCCENATLGPNPRENDGVRILYAIAKGRVRVRVWRSHGYDGRVVGHVHVLRHGGLIGGYVKGPVSLGVDGVSGCLRGTLSNPPRDHRRGPVTRGDSQQLRYVALARSRHERVVCYDGVAHHQRVRLWPAYRRREQNRVNRLQKLSRTGPARRKIGGMHVEVKKRPAA